MGVSAVEIVVIGGGVGGLTAALALALGGHRIQVLERAPRFAQGGPGLRLAPNATAVLARLGLLDQVLDLGSRPRRALLRDLGSGAELAELDLGAPLTARYGTPYVVVGRADLLSLLADACADADVELRPGREATSGKWTICFFAAQVKMKPSPINPAGIPIATTRFSTAPGANSASGTATTA